MARFRADARRPDVVSSGGERRVGNDLPMDHTDQAGPSMTGRSPLLDDATRLVPNAAFAFSESAEAFLPVLRLPSRVWD